MEEAVAQSPPAPPLAPRPTHVLLRPFWNAGERRMRALWRVLLFLVVLVVCDVGGPRLLLRGPLAGDLFLEKAVQFPLSLILVYAATRWLDRRGTTELGWQVSGRAAGDLFCGSLIGALVIAAVVGVEWMAGWLQLSVASELSPSGLLGSAARALALFVAAGVAEEVVFRSYLLRNLADGLHHRRLGAGMAIALGTILSSLAFAAVHSGNPNATFVSSVNIGLAGIMLSAGYILTGRLALSVGLHVLWNFCQYLFGLPVSGIDFGPGLFSAQQGGPDVWTGGPFGIEAGLLALFAMVAAVGGTAAFARAREGRVRLATEILGPPKDAANGLVRGDVVPTPFPMA